VPFTPEALAKRAKVAAVYGWFRQRLVLLIVAAMLVLQFMTWRAIETMRQGLPGSPHDAAHTTHVLFRSTNIRSGKFVPNEQR
jgi:hypothetical protein